MDLAFEGKLDFVDRFADSRKNDVFPSESTFKGPLDFSPGDHIHPHAFPPQFFKQTTVGIGFHGIVDVQILREGLPQNFQLLPDSFEAIDVSGRPVVIGDAREAVAQEVKFASSITETGLDFQWNLRSTSTALFVGVCPLLGVGRDHFFLHVTRNGRVFREFHGEFALPLSGGTKIC